MSEHTRKNAKLYRVRKESFHKLPKNAPAWLRWLAPSATSKGRRKLLRRMSRRQPNVARVPVRSGSPRLPRPPRSRLPKGQRPQVVPYRDTYLGSRTISIDEGYPGSASFPPNSYTIVQIVEDGFKSLDTWTSVDGNFKSPNPHSFTKSWGHNESGVLSNRGNPSSNGTKISGSNVTGFRPYPILDGYDESAYNDALAKVFEKVRGDVDISIDLAESHKTKHMMASTLRGMTNLATTFRKMRRSNPRDWGNLWLEFTYGWKPLANTIYSSAHKLLLEPGGQRHLVATGSSRGGFGTRQVNDGGTLETGVRTITYRHESRVRIRVEYAFTDSSLDSLAGFSSLNPVSIAWELTPYSFVVDWFLNVGGYLRNFESACLYGSDFVGGYVSEGYLSSATSSFRQSRINSLGSTSSQAQGYGQRVGFKRTVLTGIPFPRIPRFDPKLGASRIVSGAALLMQLVPHR